MKHLIAALTTFALLAFAVPAFACDGHKSADKGETTTTSGEKSEADHQCSSGCDHSEKDKKKAKADSDKAEGEV